jgi:hypothetical protein
MNFHKPLYPVKLFSDRNKALNWLNEIYDKI